MSSGYQVKKCMSRGVSVPASSTLAPVCGVGIANEARLNLVIDIYTGAVVGTPSLVFQDSTGYGIWNTIKTASASASTNQTVSAVSPTTGVLTIAAHGYTNGQMVAIGSTGTVPGGLDPSQAYFIQNATTNTFQLSAYQGNSNPVSSFTDSGSGTITVCAAQVVTIRMNAQVSADQAYMPLRPEGQLACTTTSGQTCQILLCNSGYTY
jgi:hypothetical protein